MHNLASLGVLMSRPKSALHTDLVRMQKSPVGLSDHFTAASGNHYSTKEAVWSQISTAHAGPYGSM